ncbi:hypothetical protein LE181_03015 [Streptomyces sp. SCA3-4]|uniref:hypothetical protein n=1 Tax=Streptomyces sichuanensis TaxID=2871810 RepID=UPI001CE35EEB|nr:hypothetical protein [Streptomyces sichuanensis]MCA6091141.1 hypothetical protein [Streptomyces sichuanensis]
MSPRRRHVAVFIAAAAATAGAGLWAAAAVGAIPHVLPVPEVTLSHASADLCLTDAAAGALQANGLSLIAQAPAVVIGKGGRQCVRVPTKDGRLATDFSTGTVTFDGAFGFARPSTGKRVLLSDLTADLTSRNIAGSAAPGPASGPPPGLAEPKELLSFTLDLAKAKVDLSHGTMSGAGTINLLGATHSIVKDALGADPLPGPVPVFDVTVGGSVDDSVVDALLQSQSQRGHVPPG